MCEKRTPFGILLGSASLKVEARHLLLTIFWVEDDPLGRGMCEACPIRHFVRLDVDLG